MVADTNAAKVETRNRRLKHIIRMVCRGKVGEMPINTPRALPMARECGSP